MVIIGISAFSHDSAVALVKDGEILCAAQEERFSRIKNDSSFPLESLKFVIKQTSISIDDIDVIVFYEKPWLKFERIVETLIGSSPFSLKLFLKSMPAWIGEKLNTRKMIGKKLRLISKELSKKKVMFSEHHFSHAASSFYTSPFKESCSVTIDGVGEWATTSIISFERDKIKILKEIHYPDSIGLFYSAMTYFCGFNINSGEYKFMGLSPYGEKDSERTQSYIRKLKSEVVCFLADGSFSLNMSYFSFHKENEMLNIKKLSSLLGLKKRSKDSPLRQEYCDFALAVQTVTEELVLGVIRHARDITKSKNLCLSGGVILNCVANKKIKDLQLFDNIWIHPSPGDAGAALGAALGYYYQNEVYNPNFSKFHPYLGMSYRDDEILEAIHVRKLEYKKYDENDILRLCAKKLKEGSVVGWFQGRMEWGPRALGARSILASPLDKKMHYRLNKKVKHRENFRPFAPVVIEEDVDNYFNGGFSSPYMQYVMGVKDAFINNDYSAQDILDQRKRIISNVPAITHVDLSARVQTVSMSNNKKFYKLLNEFKKITGHSMLINTSFNVMNEPIVCSPDDAIRCFLNTDLDYLILNNFCIEK